MTRDASTLDDPERGALATYRPLCPSAVLAMVMGLLGLVAAAAVLDLNLIVFAIAPGLGLLLGLRALGSIARYDMAGKGMARVGLAASALALVGGFAAAGIHYATEVPEGYERLAYHLLQPEGVEMYPASAEAVDGEKVYIKGYMYPTDQMDGITRFVLCRDKGSCCFGGQPKLTDMVEVTLPEDRALSFRSGLVAVGGTFRVDPDLGTGDLGGIIYRLDADFAR